MGGVPSQPQKSGLEKLNDLVTDPRHDKLTKNTHPIVLVPGFSGFGEPLFGSVNYWGGFEDLALELQLHTNVPVILPRIGPISSNWERACELYCQLHTIQRTGPQTGFDTRQDPSPTPIPVDYGQYITLPAGTPRSTKQAVVLGTLPGNWQWSRQHPVHMICHSQGGNTVRLLIELLSGRHGNRNTTYFDMALGNRQDFVKSVVTLGTPYLGTTITNVIFNDILQNVQVDEVISRLVVSAALNPTRFVDLQLGHWGFTPIEGETFRNMKNRLQNRIMAWWNSDDNGIRDNGITGIARLNRDFNPIVSPNTYYFTMSFDATRPFPREKLSGQDLRNLPVNPVLSFFGLGFPGLFNATANIVSSLVSLSYGIFSSLPGNPSDIDLAKWAVNVINNHASALGYQVRIPSPGGRIPRDDMLPILLIFSLGMSGVSAPFGSSEQNDGVVDTVSMCGPANNPIDDSDNFNRNAIISNRGVYWNLGLTEGIDHADQVGVFTDATTYNQVLKIYQLLGTLVLFLQ